MKRKSTVVVDDAVAVIFFLSGLRSASYRKVHEAFWRLSKNKKFENVLIGLDFENSQEQFYSERIDKILSRFMTAGLLLHGNPRYSDAYVSDELVKHAERVLASQSVGNQKLLKQASLIFSDIMKE